MSSKMKIVAALSICALTVGMKVGAEVSAEREQQEAKPEIHGCRLSAGSDSLSYYFDQPIILRVAVKNEGNRKVFLAIGNQMQVNCFDVRLPNGKAAPLTLEGKRQSEAPGTESGVCGLESGKENADVVAMLNRLYDMTLLGEYTVTVYRDIIPMGVNMKPVRLTSNTVRIHVRDRDAPAITTKPEHAG